MRILLDTHILLWAIEDDPALSRKARRILSDADNECLFSPISMAEIAIKYTLRPDAMPWTPDEVHEALLEAGYEELPYRSAHAEALCDLPPLHKDPFDRMLVAQAKCEQTAFMSHDDLVAGYGDTIIRV